MVRYWKIIIVNALSDIYESSMGEVLVLSGSTDLKALYSELFSTDKCWSVEINPSNQNLVLKCLNYKSVTNIQIITFLSDCFKYIDDDYIVISMLLPEHINQPSIQTSAYKTIRSKGLNVKVSLVDGSIVFGKKDSVRIPDWYFNKLIFDILKGDTVTMPIRDMSELRAIRSKIYSKTKGLKLNTNVKNGQLVISSSTKTRLPHDVSAKTMFYNWLYAAEWDKPCVYLPATESKTAYSMFSQLAGQHPLKCIKAKKGLFTKHSLCFSKLKGNVVVMYRGEMIHVTTKRSVGSLTPDDIVAINTKLTHIGKTLDDIR